MGCFTSKGNNLKGVLIQSDTSEISDTSEKSDLKQNSNLDKDLLLSLPDEIIEEIMSYLSYSDLYNLKKGGKRIRDCSVRVLQKRPFSKLIIKIVSYHGITSIWQ